METSTPKRVTFRELVEESKKRIVILAICVVGLSYLMSLTSSSVLVNLPAAASLIILLRYFAWEFEMQRKAATYNSKPASSNTITPKKPPEPPKVGELSDWKKKVNSPVVEGAMDHFTRHLVSEWVTDLWYSKLTPDGQGPEELVQIINGVLGEFAGRLRNINLIDLLTRDLINLICNHLEHFRANQAKFEKQQLQLQTIEYLDMEIRRILAAENRLHPALFSTEAENKVLQHLMDGLISYTFTHEDLQCSFFRYIVRELLACAVMRPVLNFSSPRFLNERIESVVISVMKAKGDAAAEDASQCKPNDSSRTPSDHFSKFVDSSITGVELVPLKANKATGAADNINGTNLSKDPLLSMDTQSSSSGREWGDMLDIISRRKTEVLAPENFENMWTKGRYYKKKEDKIRLVEQVHQLSSKEKTLIEENSKVMTKSGEEKYPTMLNSSENSIIHSRLSDQRPVEHSSAISATNTLDCSSIISYQEDGDHNLSFSEEIELESSGSYTSEDEEIGNVTGLDSPLTKVWDGKSNRNAIVTGIHHPLENPKKNSRKHVQCQRLVKTPSGRKRSRLSTQRLPVWQEVERSSFLSGDGQDILSVPKADDSTDDSETELFGRVYSGAAASSAASFTVNPMQNSLMVDSFYKLKCEVLGAHIVKSGSKLFAVYAISVTDVNNNSWSIKRRFRHFEELHRRLKQFPEYNLHLPPKHFLSTGLDVTVIQERCKLLDEYLKNLLQRPKISGSIEVWDFLSVDSQTYLFSNSFSIIKALPVNLDAKPSEKCKEASNLFGPETGPSLTKRDNLGPGIEEPALQRKNNLTDDAQRKRVLGDCGNASDTRVQNTVSIRNNEMNIKGKRSDGLEDSSKMFLDTATGPALPTEWIPPNLTIPILDLVDVIFQLQEGGWIRRKAFWVVKQILHLGMGDALDDWLLEKIQLLRMGSVVASGIKRVEQILWPDGIFITKHPKQQQQSSGSLPQSSPRDQHPAKQSSPRLTEDQQQEADRRAKFVYDLMIDNAPATVVSLVGRKQYEHCAKDLYYFLQSSVCLKLLAYDLLELILLSAFPELDYVFKQLHEEKHRFGEFKENWP